MLNDWKITILFYAALHLAHAKVVIGLKPNIYETRLQQNDKYLTQHVYFNDFINPNSKGKGKVKRNDPVNQNVDFQSIQLNTKAYKAYKELYTASRKSRYLTGMNQYQPNDIINGVWITPSDLSLAYNNLNTIVSFFKNHPESQVISIVDNLPTFKPL